jgi:hypothetical protein
VDGDSHAATADELISHDQNASRALTSYSYTSKDV